MPEECRKDNLPATRRTCSNCGRLGHLARTCERPGKAHDRIGIEVEGFWRNFEAIREVAEERGVTGCSDGSLDYVEGCTAWEFKTNPGSLAEAVSQLAALYPDVTNSSAGMHVHLSFTDPISITACYSQAFFDYFVARWEAWGQRMCIPESHRFWSRLRGDNTYCLKNRGGELQRDNIERGDRYRALNFTSWAEHKTLECRVLPLFRDCRVAISAVEELIAIFEDWLAVCRIEAECQLDIAGVDRGLAVPAHTEIQVDISAAAMTERTIVAIEQAAPLPLLPGHLRYFGPEAASRVYEYISSEINRQREAACASR